MTQWQQEQMVEVEVLNPERVLVKAGARVLVGLPEGSLLRVSFMLYCIPLLLLIGGALLGNILGGSETVQVVIATVMMLAGFLGVKQYTSRYQVRVRYQPVLLKVLET